MGERPLLGIEAALQAVFPVGFATKSGTGLLFQDEDGQPETLPPETLQPVDWPEVARAIDGVVDCDLIHSMRPDDFRYYLPGLVLGLALFETTPGSRLGCAVLSGLYSHEHPTHWDARFLDRWCRFTPAQYDVLAEVLPPLLTRHLGEWDGAIAAQTLALARMQAADMAADQAGG